ncbi:hypothetical protein [Anaerosporobacter faecicola]|uniref:hypothetical protein n=1 Tax=Anaerosporobacter faecicola TaxID=2718714 RepID=UPI0014396B63|nr:hypothetical protein [Anaerosporobacter faecicola]
MLKKMIRYVVVFIIVILFCGGYYLYKLSNLPKEGDVDIQASLQYDYAQKGYDLELYISKHRNSHTIIYPYIDGLSIYTFSQTNSSALYVPDSIGYDGITQNKAKERLREKTYQNSFENLVGFWIPDDEGKYETKLFYPKDNDSAYINNAYVVCVTKTELFGKVYTCSKIVSVTNPNE